MSNIFETTDPLKREVILKVDTWEKKILNYNNANDGNIHGNSHTEMIDLLDVVKASIEAPNYIIQDVNEYINENGEKIIENSTSREQYFKFFIDGNNIKCVKTVVEHSPAKERGEIVTTFKQSGKVGTKGGNVIYDSTKD